MEKFIKKEQVVVEVAVVSNLVDLTVKNFIKEVDSDSPAPGGKGSRP